MNDDDNVLKKDPYGLAHHRFKVILNRSMPFGSCEFLYRITLQMFEHHISEVKGIIDGYYCMAEDEALLVDIMDMFIQP